MPETLRLLIIEDNPAERALIEARLADIPDLAWQVADCLVDAQRLLDQGKVDVALLDLELPDARGIDSVSLLSRRNPALAIVVLSGFGGDDTVLAGETLSAGAQDYLAKRQVETVDLYRILMFAKLRKARETTEIATSLRDPLTGLPRLPLMEERFRRSLARSRRQRVETALLYIDIDGIDAIEEAHGQDRADAVVVGVARRLGQQIRRTDCLARLKDGTFVVLVDGMKHACDAYVVARKLLTCVHRPAPAPAETEAEPVPFALSIGVAIGPAAEGDFANLVGRAEVAMYEARSRGGNRYASANELTLAAE